MNKSSFPTRSCGLYKVQSHRERIVPTFLTRSWIFWEFYADGCSHGGVSGCLRWTSPSCLRDVGMLQGCWDSGQLCGDPDRIYTAAWVVFASWLYLCPCWGVLAEESGELNIEFCQSVVKLGDGQGVHSAARTSELSQPVVLSSLIQGSQLWD